jgi:hypothetical protein
MIYSDPETPDSYKCSRCGCSGVRLYRQYQTCLDHIELLCLQHALEDQHREEPDHAAEHSIGWLVAAVPTEDESTYWGYTSVPDNGVAWWNNLPRRQQQNK